MRFILTLFALCFCFSAFGLKKARKAGADEELAVLSMRYLGGKKDAIKTTLSTVVAYGKCIISTAHSFPEDIKVHIVEGSNDFGTVFIGRPELPTAGAEEPGWATGDDLAIGKLLNTPKHYLTPEDLLSEDDDLEWERHDAGSLTGKEKGIPGVLVGYGPETGDFNAVLSAEKKIGEVALLGTVGMLMLPDVLDEINERKKIVEAATEQEKIERTSEFSEFTKIDNQTLKMLSEDMGALIAGPWPDQITKGDSGGPIFVQTKSGRKLAAIVRGNLEDSPGREKSDSERFENLVKLNVIVAAPVMKHRSWMIKQWRQTCDPALKLPFER